MKIKNITDSIRQCFDKQTGEVLLVKPNEIIEREKIRFESNSFQVVNNDKVENVEQPILRLPKKNTLLKKENKQKWQ